MSTLPSLPPAGRWRTARTWLARLAINAAGFALCYDILARELWALGARYFVPLVPQNRLFYMTSDAVVCLPDYQRIITLVMCAPFAIFALALTGFALWSRRLWYVPGALLGLLLGFKRDEVGILCGVVWHAAPHTIVLLANGLGLVVAARPAACLAHRKETHMPGTCWLRTPCAPRTFASLALLALAGASLAGCEISTGHHVGDTISNATARITLTSVTVVPANATFQPAAGDELVRLHVRYTNRSRAVLNFNEVQFAVQNGAAGGDCGKDPRVGCSVPLDGTYAHYGDQGYAGYQLQPGATVESDILFEVGKGAHDARLVYQPDGMEDITNFWWLLGV
jgi:uncharacterized protein DUF4352